MRRFEFVGGGSSKFWEITQNGSQVTVHFGRINTKGQAQTKDFDSWDDAAEHVRKMVSEKQREGYAEVGGTAPAVENLPGFQRPSTLPPYEVPSLPDEGPLAVGNVQLSAGRRLKADPQYAPKGAAAVQEPVIWATTAPVDLAGRSLYWLRQDAAALNLVPILLGGLDDDPRRPWDSGEFCPGDPRRAVLVDVASELARTWSANVETVEQDVDERILAALRPFGKQFPGLASQPASWHEIRSDGDVLDQIRGRRVALVAAERPADVIAAVGWTGPINYDHDPAFLSAVLRSWEVRWYARVVEIGFAALTLTVGNPPRDEKTALALAAEHFAFCPDNVWQGSETIKAYAETLVNARTWSFWWD